MLVDALPLLHDDDGAAPATPRLTVDAPARPVLAKARIRPGTSICETRSPVSSFADLYDVADDSVTLRVHAQPGGGRSAVTGRHGGALKVKVAAPPVDGRANDAVAELLARTFGLKAAQVELVSGETSRSKRFRLDGVTPDVIDAALSQALGSASGRGPADRH